MTQDATITATSVAMLSLSSLVSLRDSGITVPDEALRDLDDKHVEHLTFSNFEEWPPIVVFEHPSGYVLTDGYHREKARQNQARLDYLETQGRFDIREQKYIEIEKAVATVPDNAQVSLNGTLTSLENGTLIKAEIRPFEGDREIIKAALLANTKHGKGLKSPVNQALAYYLITRDEEQAPNQSQVADMFSITRASLNEYIGKHNNALKKAAKEQASKKTTGDTTSEPEETKEEKKLKKAVELLKEAIENNPESTRPLMLKLFPILVTGLSQSFGMDESEDKAYAEALTEAIKMDSRSDMERLVKRLDEALNPKPVPTPKKSGDKSKSKGKTTLQVEPPVLTQEEIPSA